MTGLASFVVELEQAVGSQDPKRRITALRRVTALFMDQAQTLSEAHIGVFDDVILHLAANLERQARAELSIKLAPLPNGPRRTLRHLAYDPAIEVAGPVLELCSRLAHEDLVAIATKLGPEHLLAMSRRDGLVHDVTDILIDRGDPRVVRSLASNGGAKLSQRGFKELVARASEDVALQELLQGRADIPPHLLPQIIEAARDRAVQRLTNELGEAAAPAVVATIETAAREVGSRSAEALDGALETAIATVERKAITSGLGEEDIVRWLKAGRLEEALAAIAHVADLPIAKVLRAFHASQIDPLLFILRSTRFGWTTFQLFLAARGGAPTSEAQLGIAFDSYQKLTVETAQRVVRFTAARDRGVRPNAA